MAGFETIRQPSSGTVGDVLRRALVDQRFTRLRAAVAYVMSSGIQEISTALEATALDQRWLTSFDWCRSEPAALDALQAQTNSAVKIHRGKSVVSKPNCVPSRSFHPKTFLFIGPEDVLLLAGSANLSRNGLETGVEFDSLLYIQSPAKRTPEWKRIDEVRDWFDSEWKTADALRGLASTYRQRHQNRPLGAAVLDFDDPRPSPSSRGFSAEDLARIAQSQVMWIETGIHSETETQLMLRPLTRVFFGFSSNPLPRMTSIGAITMRVGRSLVPGRSLEFAHNSMDRINLPGPQPGWPARYNNATVIFTKSTHHGQIVFDLSIATSSEAAKLRTRSKRSALLFKMSGGGRQFGFI